MVWSIYGLAVLAQIVCLVSAQDYCTDRCKDADLYPDVVCTCVECPEHTCKAGQIECSFEHHQCTTMGLDQKAIEEMVCPKSTECIEEGCECPIPGCEAFSLKCDKCQIDQAPPPGCLICCARGECEANYCPPQSDFGKGTDGELCPAFCAKECVPTDNIICCKNEIEANGCLKEPGEMIEVELTKEQQECDEHFCPCPACDKETGKCCEVPKDDKGCDMEEQICVKKKTDPKTGEPCLNVHCPLDVECDPTKQWRITACEECELDRCCDKSIDFNGQNCPEDYDHNCDHVESCRCGCDDGICCEGCEEKLGCKPSGKCIPLEDVRTDNNGNACPKESVCPCCCDANHQCCPQGEGSDGCKKEDNCEPKMIGDCDAHCECVVGIDCPHGEKCCPPHKDKHGCDGPPTCTNCGTKTKGFCEGEPCECECPESCELPRQILCESQENCDGCPTQQVCRTREKDVNDEYCDEDSASHGCPILCDEVLGECACIPAKDILGCRGKAWCAKRKRGKNGGFCPFETACPTPCTEAEGPAKECGLDDDGCPVWKCGSCDTDLGLMNAGVDCWNDCGGKQGPCDWCGNGLCCQKGWSDTSNGCDGSFGGNTRHECVLKPGVSEEEEEETEETEETAPTEAPDEVPAEVPAGPPAGPPAE